MAKRFMYNGRLCAGLLARAGAVISTQSAIFCTLLLALTLSGTIPQGFMRATGENGMMLVLCTPEGPAEVWQSADGEIHDEVPLETNTSSDCLGITLSLVLVQSWLDTLAQPVEFSTYRAIFTDRRHALTPALSPLQPRAPPALA